ncbi:MAG TPA: hypothetical protein VHY91_24060 [Pirellulales bacterium]|nr:hypothetical protein [Pirellulales bacterium]
MLRLKPAPCRCWTAARAATSITSLCVIGGLLLGVGTPQAQAKKLNPNNKAQAANLAQNWRAALLSELSFVRQICPDLTPEQRVPIKAAAEQALLAAADELAGTQDMLNYKGLTPQAMIRVAVAAELHKALPADQFEHFAAEAEARVKRRQTAVVELLVEHVDQALFLRPEQRDQIRGALAEHWRPVWEGWLQLRFMQGTPNLSNDEVVPFLDAEQKAAWQTVAKIPLYPHYITGQMNNGQPVNNDWWDEGLPKDKAKPAADDVPAPPAGNDR